MICAPRRATSTREARTCRTTSALLGQADQCPSPNFFVRSRATAVRSATSARASFGVATVMGVFIDVDLHLPEKMQVRAAHRQRLLPAFQMYVRGLVRTARDMT